MFTKGEWKVRTTGDDIRKGIDIIISGSGANIASINDGWDNPTMEANANLIAASPDMYEAIQVIEDLITRLMRRYWRLVITE